MITSPAGILPESAHNTEKLLAALPFGICLMDLDERILWANPTLCEQLGVTAQQVPGLTFDELPMQVCKNSIDGVYSPRHRPQLKLRLVTTPLSDDMKLAALTDVTDLASNAGGHIDVLRELVRTDSDTGLLTSNAIYRELLTEVARSRRYGNFLTVIRIEMNLAGSEADRQELSQLVGVKLADNVRAIDCIGILNGGQFLVVLTETDVRGAQRFVNKMQSLLKSHIIQEQLGHPVDVSFRFGTAQWNASDDVSTLLNKASERLAA